MTSMRITGLCIVLMTLTLTERLVIGEPDPAPIVHDGKWKPDVYGTGNYIHQDQPYVHDAKRYDGGFGEYIHDYKPWEDNTLYKSQWKYWRRCRCY